MNKTLSYTTKGIASGSCLIVFFILYIKYKLVVGTITQPNNKKIQ